MHAVGPMGAAGVAGVAGPMGVMGAIGPVGPMGAIGPTIQNRPFPPAMGFCEAPLPPELLNEPYTSQDNGLRVSQTSHTKRAPFSFEITGAGTVTCTIGDKIIADRYYSYSTRLTKNRSRVSVISVFDVYGLEVTYAFLKHLYTKEGDKAWVATYLRASLFVLDDSSDNNQSFIRMEDNISLLTSTLLYYLAALHHSLPRVVPSETELTLPMELLAKITNNPALCSTLREEVSAARAVNPYN